MTSNICFGHKQHIYKICSDGTGLKSAILVEIVFCTEYVKKSFPPNSVHLGQLTKLSPVNGDSTPHIFDDKPSLVNTSIPLTGS